MGEPETTQTQIRPATDADAAAIAAVGRASFTWAFGHLFPADVLARYLDQTYSEAKIRASLAKPRNIYFVALRAGQLHGFLKLKGHCPHPAVTASAPWQVQKLYIMPDVIQQGLGRTLMHTGEAMMEEHRVDCSWLLVYKGNERALRFYDRLGFAAAGVEFHDFEHIRVEFRLMTKNYGSSARAPAAPAALA